MYKMVLQAVIFTALAIGFIVTKSDGLRQASRTGDLSALTQSNPIQGIDVADPALKGPKGPWYAALDPRKIWRDRPQKAKLKVKTIQASDAEGRDMTIEEQLAAKGLSGDVVSVVKLD